MEVLLLGLGLGSGLGSGLGLIWHDYGLYQDAVSFLCLATNLKPNPNPKVTQAHPQYKETT